MWFSRSSGGRAKCDRFLKPIGARKASVKGLCKVPGTFDIVASVGGNSVHEHFTERAQERDMAKQQHGKLWQIVEDWRNSLDFPPSYRQIAVKMGVSSTSFETWKNPVDIPHRRNLLAISRVTGVPYRKVVDAAIEDTQLYSEEAAEASTRSDTA